MALYAAEAKISLQDQISGPWRSMASKLRGSANTLQSTVGRAFSGMRMRVNRAIRGIINPIKTLLPILGAAGLAMEFRNVVREAAGFSEQMAKVGTMLNNATMTILPQFREEVAAMSTQFGRSTEDLADGLYNVLSAGIPATKAMQHLKIVTIGAIGGFAPLGEVARAVSAIMNGFTRENVSATRAVDVLSAIVEDGITNMRELAPAIGGVTGIAGSMGVKFNELAGMIAIVSKSGRGAAPVIMSIRALLASLTKRTGESADEMAMLDKVFREKGVVAFARALKNANLTTEEMGRIFPDMRSKLALAFLTGNIEKLEAAINKAANSAGMGMKKAETMMESARFKMAQAREEANALRREIGGALLPGLIDAMKVVTNLLKEDFIIKALRDMGTILGGLLADLARIGAGIALLSKEATQAFRTATGEAEKAEGWLKTAWTFWKGVVAGESEKGMAAAKSRAEALSNLITGTAMSVVSRLLGLLRPAVTMGLSLFAGALALVMGKTTNAASKIIDTVDTFIGDAISAWQTKAGTYKASAVDYALKTQDEVLDKLLPGFNKTGSFLKDKAKKMGKDVIDYLKDELGSGLEASRRKLKDFITTPGLFGPEDPTKKRMKELMGVGVEGVTRMVMGIVPGPGGGFGARGMESAKLARSIRQFGPEEGLKRFQAQRQRQFGYLTRPMMRFEEQLTPTAGERMARMMRRAPAEFGEKVSGQIFELQMALSTAVVGGKAGKAQAIMGRIGQLEALRGQVAPGLQAQLAQLKKLAEYSKTLDKTGKEVIPEKIKQGIAKLEKALGKKSPLEEALNEASEKLKKAVEKELTEQSKAIMGVGATMWGGSSLKDVVEAIKNIKAIAKAQAIAISEGGRIVEETSVAPANFPVDRQWTEPRSEPTVPV